VRCINAQEPVLTQVGCVRGTALVLHLINVFVIMDFTDNLVNRIGVMEMYTITQMYVLRMERVWHQIHVVVIRVILVVTVNYGHVTVLCTITRLCALLMELVLLLTFVNAIMDTLVTNAPNGTVSVTNVVVMERVMHLISVGVIQDTTDRTALDILVAEWYSIPHKHVLETEHV